MASIKDTILEYVKKEYLETDDDREPVSYTHLDVYKRQLRILWSTNCSFFFKDTLRF